MTKLKKGLVLLLILTIVCSLFVLVACKDPNAQSPEIPGEEQEEPSEEQEPSDENKKPNNGTQKTDTLVIAYKNYKGEEVDYSLYFETDGNGKITDLSDFAIQNKDSIIQLEIPKKIGDEEINALSLNFDALPYLRSLTISENINTIDEPLKISDNNPFLLIFCETTEKSIGWCDDWRPQNIEDLSLYPPVVWDYKNNEVADDGKIYGFASNGMLYALKDNDAELVFSGIEDIENLELTSSVKYNDKTYSLKGMYSCSFFGIKDDLPLQNNKNLKSVKIPNGVTSISPFVFGGSSLTSIDIPNSVTNIGECAFYFCTGLKSIEIPRGVANIGSLAFVFCNNLESITVDSENTNYKSNGNCLIETQTNTVIVGCKNSVIPNYVTSIGQNAFAYCSGLESIRIPSSVINIGESAFAECSSLTSVTFGENSQLTSIGDQAFYICSNLESIEIPSSVRSIGKFAFYECDSLIEVHIEDIESWCKIEFENKEANPLYRAHNLYLNNILLTDLEIPSSVKSIGNYAFYECSSLESVRFAENSQLTSIGDQAFSNSNISTSIEIPSSVTSIGMLAFGSLDLEIVIFENTNGWYWWSDTYGEISIDVTNPSENVDILAMGIPLKRKVD